MAFQFSAGSGAAADTCAKLKGFWLDLTPSAQGYLVPVTIAGSPRRLELSTEAAFAQIDEAVASDLKLPLIDAPRDAEVYEGSERLAHIATASTFQLGPVPRPNAQFLVRPHKDGAKPEADGVAGMNLFWPLDMEIDLTHGKLGLFLPDHCPFEPYWDYDVVGNAEMTVDPTGLALLPMELDGHKVEVSIDTTASVSTMPMKAAHMLLGIEEDDPALRPVDGGKNGDRVFRYPFKTLSAGGVTIGNPDIYIDDTKVCGGVAGRWYGRSHSRQCYGNGDVVLGLKELRKLRWFLAFKERKVYFTPADAR